MDRPYDTGNSNSVSMFVGTEVEHTPAFGMRTLFVVGIQPTEQIHAAAMAYQCQHIYFGANQSFPNPDVNDGATWRPWEQMIYFFLRSGISETQHYFCTLDIDVKAVEGLLESGLTEQHNFIPMISVKLPYIDQLGYNATIKLDDKGFAESNPGVWCHSLHELKNRKVFTDWSKYTQDEVVK